MAFNPFHDPYFAGRGASLSDIFARNRGGAVTRPRKAEPKPEEAPAGEVDEGPEEAAPEGEAKDKVVLRNPKWEVEEVGFNEETEISVEAEVPEAQAHKTKVEFKLFAKTPNGPESISKAEGTLKAGKALGRIPVYIPQYKDEDGNLLAKVEYYFTAKHSLSDLLEDESVIKEVDRMADRLIESHVIEDLTFATGKSQVRADQAAALKALVDCIGAWKERHPDGKLAVFGHADAVGKEEPNKKLSERRARAVHAFLIKDAAGWDALAKEEKWDAPPEAKAFMAEHNPLSLSAKDFDAIDGKPFAGCSEFNLVEDTPGASARNRRVAVFLLKSNKNFPIQYPCKQGDVGVCRKQKARKGERRTPGFGCCFYDGLVKENAGAGGSVGDGKVLEAYFEDEAGKRIEITRAGKKVFLVLKSENLVGKKVDIDLSDVAFDVEYRDTVLEKGLLSAFEVSEDLQKIEFIPRKRAREKTRGQDPQEGEGDAGDTPDGE
jgi:outer membrane protein OmpA-like peptidoglycan-associated protein